MTREEAHKILSNGLVNAPSEHEWCMAFRMAIKVLEQQPCKDAISRQAVLDGLACIAKAKAKSDAQKSLMGRVMFFTEHLPSVTPQPKIDVLDKIIAEIQNLRNYTCDYSDDVIDDVEDIINKYKAERSGEE